VLMRQCNTGILTDYCTIFLPEKVIHRNPSVLLTNFLPHATI